MRTERKRYAIILGIIVLLLLCAVVPAFALLIHDTNIDFNTEFGEIPADAIDFSMQSHQAFIFTHAGERKDIDLKVLNKADKAMRYSYEIAVSEDSQGLENAVFAYFDDEFIGSLASAKASPLEVSNNDYLLGAKVGEISDSTNHKLTFELHNGADGSAYQNKEFKVTVTMRGSTINYQENIFVSTIDELNKAIDDVNYSDTYKTIRLANNIALNNNFKLTKACDIDLMGHELKFNGNLLTFAFSEVGAAKIYSSRITSDNTEIRGIVLASDKTTLLFGANAMSYNKAVAINACDVPMAEKLLAENIKMLLGNGVLGGEKVAVAEGFLHYIKSGKLTLVASYGAYTLTDGAIAVGNITRTSLAAITVGKEVVEFKILGQDESGYTAILGQKFAYLNMLTIENYDSDVDFDLYLPRRFEDINASVEWQSLNPNILSDIGVCGGSVEGLATMIAYVNINGTTITFSMTFSILKQTNQMRFDYLVARIGEQNLSALYDVSMPSGSYFTLPTVNQGTADDYRAMYAMRSLGLESLTYELSPTFYYLSKMGTDNRIHLIEPTLDTFAEVMIKGKFSNERDKEYISYIGVQIKTLDNTKLHQQILDYIQTLLNDVDILQNVLDTRALHGMANERGDFMLPAEYKGFDLSYSSDDPMFRAIEYIPPTEDLDGQYKFILDLSKLSVKLGVAIIQASIRIKGATEQSLTTKSPMKVNTPAAIVMAEGGINDRQLFNSIKIQTVQQLVNLDGTLQKGVPIISQITDSDAELLNGYILMRDVAYVKTMIIRTGDYPYDNLAKKHDYDASVNLYFYSVNEFTAVYSGLGLFNNLTYLAVNNNAQLFNGVSQLSGALLDMIASEYKQLTHLEMTRASLTTAVQTLKLAHLTHLDIRGNSALVNMEFLCERTGNQLNYLDISDTGYDYNADFGVLSAMYYRHTILGGNPPPQWYYSYNSTRVLYLNSDTVSALEASFYIYTLSLAKDNITSVAVQLKWDIITKTLGTLKFNWTVATSVNHAGLNIGNVLIDNALSKVKLINNILGTAKPTDGRLYENCNLSVSLQYKDLQTGTDNTVSRLFKLKLAY